MLYHQTVSPSVCSCVYEEQFEYDTVTNQVVGQPTLAFFHNVCERHEPLVINKPKINPQVLKNMRQNMAGHKQVLLDNNRTRHLKDFDDNPHRKQIQDSLNEIKKTMPQAAARMQAEIDNDRTKQEEFLDGHEQKSMNTLVLGIHSPYAFNAQEVYDAIQQEFRQANV